VKLSEMCYFFLDKCSLIMYMYLYYRCGTKVEKLTYAKWITYHMIPNVNKIM